MTIISSPLKTKLSWLLKHDRAVVIFLWLFFQCLWYLHFGFVTSTLEAPKYISEAQYILEHHAFSQFRYLFYFTTIAVIAFSLTINIGATGALFILMAINLSAYVFLFSALKKFFRQPLPALLIVIALLSFWPYQSWALFLFTECIFYSLVMLLFGHLLRFNGLTFRFLTIAFLLLFLLIISRPLGILFVLPVILFIFMHITKRQRLYLLLAGFGFLFLLNYIVDVFFTTTSDWSMNYALTGDMITCDMPVNSGYQPQLSNHPNQLYQLVYYLQHNFSHFIGLAAVRLRYFFFLAKPFYSFGHNLYLLIYVAAIYGSIIWNIRRIVRTVPIALLLFMFSSILLFALATALQCDEYHSRFALTLTPFFVMLTIAGWWPSIRTVLKLRSENH